jgi:hypothetical protein
MKKIATPALAVLGCAAFLLQHSPAATADEEIPADIVGVGSVSSSRVGLFDVQGIRLGMKLSEVETALQKKGYKLAGSAGNVWTFKLGTASDYKEVRVSGSLVGSGMVAWSIAYTQRFTNAFDKDAIRKQVEEKYGTANKAEPFGTAILLHYYDSPESVNTLTSKAREQCYAEIVASGKPGYTATGLSGNSTQANLWGQRGDAAVRANCPKTLPVYYKSVKSYFAPQMTVGVGRDVNSGTASQFPSTLSIHIYSQALKEDAVIEATRKEKARLQTAPPAKADL